MRKLLHVSVCRLTTDKSIQKKLMSLKVVHTIPISKETALGG